MFLQRSRFFIGSKLISSIGKMKMFSLQSSLKANEPPTKYLTIYQAKSDRQIAYKEFQGEGSKHVVYIPGFMSNMSGNKSKALSDFCQKHNLSYTRYDPTGLGESMSISLHDARLSHWIQDADSVINHIDKPLVLIGSSMGAWISFLLCEKYLEKIRGVVCIAPAVNFTDRHSKGIRSLLSSTEIKKIEEGNHVYFSHPEYGSFPISNGLFTDMKSHEVDLKKGLNVQCPVRIFHGFLDADVPYMESLALCKSIKATDVQVTFIKDGNHRLWREQDLDLIFNQVLQLTLI